MPDLLNPKNDEKFSAQELKFSEWFLTHKILLRKILTGIIIGIAGMLWIYSLIGFVDWLLVTGPKERANLNTTLQIKLAPGVLPSIAAQNIVFTEAQIFSGGASRYDLFAQVTNPNLSKWWAEFEYRFSGEGLDGVLKKGFVLPGETKYIAALGVERPYYPRNVRLEVRNLKYHRVDPHKILDYAKWRGERLNMIIRDKVFNPAASSNGKNIASLKFTAANDTAYGYRSVGFYGSLYRGEQLVAINYLAAEDFAAGEARELQMQFSEGLPTITKYEIVPEVNIFDESAYKEL